MNGFLSVSKAFLLFPHHLVAFLALSSPCPSPPSACVWGTYPHSCSSQVALGHSDTRSEMTGCGEKRAGQTSEATRLPAFCFLPPLLHSQESHSSPSPPPPQTMAVTDDGLDWGPGHHYVAGSISARQRGH